MIDKWERIRNKIPLEGVAVFYRRGVTRERIRQIECGGVSSAVEREYRKALRLATKHFGRPRYLKRRKVPATKVVFSS